MYCKFSACAQECARDLARHKQCSVGLFACDNIARRDFMIAIDRPYACHIFTVLIIHTFDAFKFEIKTFIQPFGNFIKGALVRDLRRSSA